MAKTREKLKYGSRRYLGNPNQVSLVQVPFDTIFCFYILPGENEIGRFSRESSEVYKQSKWNTQKFRQVVGPKKLITKILDAYEELMKDEAMKLPIKIR